MLPSFSFNDAYRIIKNVVDERIGALTRSGAGVEVTWGVVAALITPHECTVYIEGQGTASGGFRTLNGVRPNVGDPVMVNIDKRGNRWISAVLGPSTGFNKLEIDVRGGVIRQGDGTVAPTKTTLNTDHEAAANPHPGYATDADLTAHLDDNTPHPATQGTAFPVGAVSGQRFFRTDRNLEYFWDGSRWLCVCLHQATGSQPGSFSATTLVSRFVHPGRQQGYSVWIERFAWTMWMDSGTNDGTNYWQGAVHTIDGGTEAFIAFANSSNLGNSQLAISVAHGVAYASSIEGISMRLAKINSPTTIQDVGCSMDWRYIG